MSLRCKLGYHSWEIVDVSMTTVESMDGGFTVCVLKEYKCRRCGGKDFKQTWESESCRKFFEEHYKCDTEEK